MRKSINFLFLLFFAISCNNNASSPESTTTSADSAATQVSDSSMPMSSPMVDTVNVGAGITAAEVIIEVTDAKTGAGLANANVSVQYQDKTISFSPTDVAGQYFTMEDLSTMSGYSLNVKKDGYAAFTQTVDARNALPKQVKLTPGK